MWVDASETLVVKTGSSYLSQSELPVTFGLGPASQVDRVEVVWPSGVTETARDLPAGKYDWIEGRGVVRWSRLDLLVKAAAMALEERMDKVDALFGA